MAFTNFILVSTVSCTFKDGTSNSNNCKTYNNDYKGYTPQTSAGQWTLADYAPYDYITVNDVEGLEFAGWYTIQDKTWGTTETSNILIKNTRTFYYTDISSGGRYGNLSEVRFICMKYRYPEHICILNPNGGTVDTYFIRVRKGETFQTLPTPSWNGRTFLGWYTEIEGGTLVQSGDIVTQNTDFTLYAHWNYTEQLTVLFDAGGGTSTESSRIVNKGDAIGTLPTATWVGYYFGGWFSQSGGSGQEILSTTLINNDITIYANWSPWRYLLNFDGRGGTPSFTSKYVYYTCQYGTLPTCSKPGNTFLGWYSDQSLTVKVEPTSIIIPQNNRVLYAKWSDDDPSKKWYYLVS